MRLIVQHQTAQLYKKSNRIQISDNISSDEFLKLLAQRLQLSESKIIVKIKKDGLILRIIKGWDMKIYELYDGQIVTVQEIYNEQQQIQQKKQKLFQKLKLSQDFSGNRSPSVDSQNRLSTQNPNQQDDDTNISEMRNFLSSRSDSYDSEENIRNKQNLDNRLKLDQKLENILKLTKSGKKEDIMQLFKEINSDLQNYDKTQEELQMQMVNEIGTGGWGPLHFAVFQNYLEIVEYFVMIGADINKQTNDGWTALQLSVHKNLKEITLSLLKQTDININMVTQRGSALHLACRRGKKEFIQILIEHNADPYNLNENDKTCIQVCSDQECVNLINELIEKKQLPQTPVKRTQTKTKRSMFSISSKKQSTNKVSYPPPVVYGTGYKYGRWIKTMRIRYFVLDPFQGTLIRYKDKSECPLKPMEVIPLKDINNVQIINRFWYMHSEFFYFEFTYDSKNYSIGYKQEQTCQIWAFFLQEAVRFAKQQELQDQKEIQLNQKIERLELLDTQYDDYKISKEFIQEIMANSLPHISHIEITLDNQQEKYYNEVEQLKSLDKNQQQIEQQQNVAQKLNFENIVVHSPEKQTSNTDMQLDNSFPKQNSMGSVTSNIFEKQSPNMPILPNTQTQHNINNMSLLKDQEEIEFQLNINNENRKKVNFSSFQYQKLIGEGSFGKVFLAVKKDDPNKTQFAIKVLKKKQLFRMRQLKYAINEAKAMKICSSPFILKLQYAFQTPYNLHLVLDMCTGGDFSQLLAHKVILPEDQAKFYIAQLILAIENMHNNGIIHRDIKPENILLDNEGNIKLADFGLCKTGILDTDTTRTYCGSRAYVSPEMLKKQGVGKPADIYGIGTILYEILIGEPPYYDDDEHVMEHNILEGELKFESEIYYEDNSNSKIVTVSENAKSLLKGLLERDINQRLGIPQIKQHIFFKDLDWNKLERLEYQPPINNIEQNMQDSDDDEDEMLQTQQLLMLQNPNQVIRDKDYNEDNHNINRVPDFTFQRFDL